MARITYTEYIDGKEEAGIPEPPYTLSGVDASNSEVGVSKGFAFHFVLTDNRGSMSSRLCEKSAYRLHAENKRRLPRHNEMNVGGVARAETHIPSAGKPPGSHAQEADPKRV